MQERLCDLSSVFSRSFSFSQVYFRYICNKYMSHLISLTLSKALQVSYVELKAFGRLKISLLFQKKEVAYMMVNPAHSHFLQYSCWDVYVLLHKAWNIIILVKNDGKQSAKEWTLCGICGECRYQIASIFRTPLGL